MTSFKIFVSETENLVLHSLIPCKPVKIFENRRDTSDGLGTGIENKLKTMKTILCISNVSL